MRNLHPGLNSFLERPHVGAAGVFRSALANSFGSRWIVRLFRYGSWLLIFFVAFLTFLPSHNIEPANLKDVSWVLSFYAAYVVLLEFASRKLEEVYDRIWFRCLRIGVNIITVTTLSWLSPGTHRYYWIFYLLPIFQAIIYFSLAGLITVLGIITTIYWAFAAVLGRVPDGPDLPLLVINTVALLLLALTFYLLFGASTQSSELAYEEMKALRLTALDLASELDLKQLLEKIVRRSAEILRAKGGGIYDYDRDTGVLTVVADWGVEPSIVGRQLRIGEGMAGRVVVSGESLVVDNYVTWSGRAPNLESDLFRAVAEVPLKTSNEVLGVLYVTNTLDDRVFNERDVQLLELLASHASVAIKNAEEFEESRSHLLQLALIDRISQRLTNALTLDQIMQVTLEEALKGVGAVEGSIMQVDQQTGELEIKAWVVGGEPASPKGHKKFAPDEGIAGYVAATGKPYNCPDTSKDERFAPSFTGRHIGALLSVPIIVNDHVFCVVNVDSERPIPFLDRHKELLVNLAVHVATAIEAQTLRDLGIAISQVSPEGLYPQITEKACLLTGSDVSTIFLLDEESASITRVALFPPSIKANDAKVRDDGLTRRILSSGDAMVITDVQQDPLVKQEIKDRGVKSMIGAPLLVTVKENGNRAVKVLGVLFVSSTKKRNFGERDKELIQSLANQIAVAIQNTRNLEALKSQLTLSDSLLDSAFDAIVATDNEGRITRCNSAAERILGYAFYEIKGHTVGQYFAREDQAREILHALATDGRVIDYQTIVIGKDKQKIPIRLSATRLDHGTVGYFKDLRDLESANRRIRLLTALMEASQAITEFQDTEDKTAVFSTTIAKTKETLRADLVSLYPYDEETAEIKSPIRDGELFGKPSDSSTSRIVDSIIELGKIYFSEDAESDKLLAGSFVKHQRIRSAVACPLKVRGKLVGIIFCSYRRPHSFFPEEKAVIQLFFSGVAIAIENARLYAEVQDRIEEINGLYKVALMYVGGLSPEADLQNLLAQARRLTKARYAAMHIVGSDWRTEPLFITSGLTAEESTSIGSHPEGKGVLALIAKSSPLVNLSDLTQHQNFTGSFPESHPEIKSFLGTPMYSGAQFVGNFYVATKSHNRAFNERDEFYLKTLADIALKVMERAHGQQEIKAIQTANIAFLLQSSWARTIRHRSQSLRQQLKEIDGTLTETTAEVFKELNEMLHELEAPGGVSQQQTVEESLREPINFRELLSKAINSRSVLEHFQEAANRAGIEQAIHPDVKLGEESWVQGDPFLLETAVSILIENAIEAIETKKTTPVYLRLRSRVKNNQVHVSVKDSGAGIPPQIQPYLFNVPLKGRRGRFKYSSVTAGMIIRIHRGEIEIVETGPNGTEISFWLPLT